VAAPAAPVAAAAHSTHGEVEAAIAEVGDALAGSIGRGADLLTVHFTADHREHAGLILRRLQRRLAPESLAGCTVSGVVAGGREFQSGPVLSAMALRLPGSRVQAFHLDLDEEAGVVHGWPDVGADAGVVLMPDPFTFPVAPFLDSLRKQRPDLPAIVGGIASGASRAGSNVLLTEDGMHERGAVGFVIQGGVRLEAIVAQGTRAIGPSLRVTRSEKNVVYELGGRPAYEGLSAVLEELGEEERGGFMRAPHVGLRPVASDSGEDGADCLVRGVMGVDPEAGAIAIAEPVHDGLVLQFQTRDRDAADRELHALLEMASSYHPRALAAFLFPCTGRGLHLFQEADHDVTALHRHWPGLPVSGFFAAGEIGPVCGRPYVHGLTASIGLLVPEV
jgi:small ligand-binding sensory domain FIST